MLLRGVIQSLNNLANEQSEDRDTPELNRRGFFRVAAAAAATAGGLAVQPALAKSRERCLAFYCPNTGETIRVVYWTPTEGYISESVAEVSYALRDILPRPIKPPLVGKAKANTAYARSTPFDILFEKT